MAGRPINAHRRARYRRRKMTATTDAIPPLDDPQGADVSSRFALPPDAPYLPNLAALWAVDHKLAMAIEALEGAPSHPTEPAKSGEPTVSITAPDGRRLYLHSRHRPLDEARRAVDPIDTQQHVFYYIHGLGLGYTLQLLFERAGDEAVFCVFEPDLLMLRTAMEARDLAVILESRRVYFFWQLDKSDLFVRLMPHTAMVNLGTTELAHAPSLQRHPEFHEQMRGWLAEFASFCRTNMNTLVMNGRRTLENIARNVGWYAAAPSAGRLKDRFKNAPAVIVSAGPSLRKNKHLLMDMVGKAVVIAVQTTLQPLLEMGIEPDFVTALDYHDICTRFFEKLPKQLKTELVAEPKATNLIFSLNPGPLTLIGNDAAESLLREMQLKKAGLPSGSTVAHLAYYLAEHLGCNPIVFVGQDLGFTDGLYYAPGTSYEDVWRPELGRFSTIEMKQWEQIVRERPIMRKIPDQQGRPMYTEERLFTYLQQFERDFLRSDRMIIDASEGGAAKRGTTVMKLAEVIAQFCQHPLAVVDSDCDGLQWNRTGDCVASLERRKTEAAEIERISRETLPLLQEIHDQVDNQQRVNRAIARIDLLRTQMNALGRTYDLVTQLTQTSEMRRFQADRKISAAKLSGLDLQREQVKRDIDNVRGVERAAKEFQGLMDEVIAQLSRGAAEAGVA